MKPPLCVSFGGGENSAALLLGYMDRGIRPDLITFADTGGEKPHTYDFVCMFGDYLLANGFPEIMWVKNAGVYKSLEDNCLKKNMLPSLAYGFKSCSKKYKIRPQDEFISRWAPAVDTWHRGEKVTKAIGFDAGERHRAAVPDCDQYHFVYPLIEWDWGRDECQARILEAGLPLPGKSSCFFCPASRKIEVRDLAKNYPDLFERAIAMERNADLQTVEGLGRSYSWEEYVAADGKQGRLFPEAPEIPCMCYDGGGED